MDGLHQQRHPQHKRYKFIASIIDLLKSQLQEKWHQR